MKDLYKFKCTPVPFQHEVDHPHQGWAPLWENEIICNHDCEMRYNKYELFNLCNEILNV